MLRDEASASRNRAPIHPPRRDDAVARPTHTTTDLSVWLSSS